MGAKNVNIGMSHTSSEFKVQTLEHPSAVDQFVNMDFRKYQSTAHQAPVNKCYLPFVIIGLGFLFIALGAEIRNRPKEV